MLMRDKKIINVEKPWEKIVRLNLNSNLELFLGTRLTACVYKTGRAHRKWLTRHSCINIH